MLVEALRVHQDITLNVFYNKGKKGYYIKRPVITTVVPAFFDVICDLFNRSSVNQNFVKIGKSIDQLHRTYDDAQRQLTTGRGNIVSQLEGWKEKGLNPSASMPDGLTFDEE